MRVLYTGKVKDVFELDEQHLLFRFSDRISAFDKQIPSQVPSKGEALCRTAAFWFKLLREEGIPSHFVSLKSSTEMVVRRFHSSFGHRDSSPRGKPSFIPLEVISRHYVDRWSDGPFDVPPSQREACEGGRQLPSPVIEFTTKFEASDRPVDDSEAMQIARLSEGSLRQIKDLTLQIDSLIAKEVGVRNILHVDGKKEFGLDDYGRLVVVDTFGTLDEDRWWDATSFSQGRGVIELSKQLVRQFYKKEGYAQALAFARENGKPEPPIPPLPAEFVARLSRLYVEMFERITGSVW